MIVGRSGFQVFKDDPSALKIFIVADLNSRVRHIMEQYAVDEDTALKTSERNIRIFSH